MKTLHMKKPSASARGHLGSQTLGKQFAITKYINQTTILQRRRKSILPLPVDFYRAEVDGLKEYKDGWAWGCCPFHPDSKPSFTVNLESGAFRCMSSSCGVHGGSIVSFVSQLHNLDQHEAFTYLGDWR